MIFFIALLVFVYDCVLLDFKFRLQKYKKNLKVKQNRHNSFTKAQKR